MIRSKRLLIFLAMLVAGPTAVLGWLRTTYEDATIVQRSELIVVGRLSRESIERVWHEPQPSGAQSWEYHATLLISEILKGKPSGKEIPITIHYGLTPGSLGAEEGGTLGLYDSGNSAVSFEPLIADVQAENLWFLRRRAGIYGKQPGTGKYGIVDPEDVQPLEWREYFLSYLDPDPAAALAEYARRNLPKSYRAQRYLDHLDVQRILAIEDPSERANKLLPYFLKFRDGDILTMNGIWNGVWETRDGLVACGPVAGEKLKGIFADPKYHQFRSDIIRMWREMRYRDAAPLLINLLKEHDLFWKRQRLVKGWWNNDPYSEQTRRRREIYSEVYGAVYTLRSFRDPKAKEVLEATRNRWKELDFENSQIVEECEAALRELAELEKPHR